jgi:hypothetical protein
MFFLNVSLSQALTCYQCDSSKDEYCPETWDREDIKPQDCSHIDNPRFCVKTTGIYGAIVGTRRFCSSRHLDNSCQEVNFPQDPRIYYSCVYTCGSDGCNSANSFKNSQIIAAIIVNFLIINVLKAFFVQ